MRLSPDPEVVAFREELNHWLDENMPTKDETREPRRSSGHLPGWARAWQRKLFDAGWLIPGYPPEYGGRNASAAEQMAYFEIMAKRQVPRALNPQGLSICAPTIIDHGTTEQIEHYALPTLRGEKTGCVGMSEPDAGSDLASLSTRAVLDGDRFVVNGQKVWTSGAHEADYCLLFVRTDVEAPKHRGISLLIVDMNLPGVECRPIAELTDPHHTDFNEVFFSEVVVSADRLVGKLNEGWSLAQGSLGHERSMLWVMNAASLDRALKGLVRLASRRDGKGALLGDDPRFTDELAEVAMDAAALWCLGYLGFAKASAGEHAPAEHVILKLFSSEAEQRAKRVGMEALGAEALMLDGPGPFRMDVGDHSPGTASDGDVGDHSPGTGSDGEPVWTNPFSDGPWVVEYLRSFAGTIAGGTSEIQRNIIAEKLLKLPRG